MSLFHTAKHIGKAISLGWKSAKLVGILPDVVDELRSAPIMSEQELRSYLLRICEETNKGLPKNLSPTRRYEKMYVTPNSHRSVTFEETRLDFSKDLTSAQEITSAIAEDRAVQLRSYRTGNDFPKVCRANGVTHRFVINDKNRRQLGVYQIGPSDLN